MEKTNVQKLAKVLKTLVTITFVCNLLVLPTVPGLAGLRGNGGWFAFWGMTEGSGVPAPLAFLAVCWQYLFRAWREPYAGVLAGFLIACGCCTAVILWQARQVLDTILEGNPFQKKNGESMKRAAVCFFAISAAALVRVVVQVASYGRFTVYNALFIPVFAMGGLLCLVMAALFHQAADLQEDSDLTI